MQILVQIRIKVDCYYVIIVATSVPLKNKTHVLLIDESAPPIAHINPHNTEGFNLATTASHIMCVNKIASFPTVKQNDTRKNIFN